jgi:ABC-2 type transport system ATP-binding protein
VNKGKKILDGTVKGIKSEYKENMYRIGAAILPEHLSNPAFEVIKHQPDELLIKLAAGTETNDVLQYFIAKNVTIHAFSEVLPSLNEIFIKLVEGTKTARQFQPIN